MVFSEITEFQSVDERKLGKFLSACSKTLTFSIWKSAHRGDWVWFDNQGGTRY